MSLCPERRRWLSLVRAVHRNQIALVTKILERMSTRDSSALNLDEKRDLTTLIALCEHAAVLCDRLISSLSDDEA